MSREGIEKKIESLLQRMKYLKIQYSDCEDQLSDLYSSLEVATTQGSEDGNKDEDKEE